MVWMVGFPFFDNVCKIDKYIDRRIDMINQSLVVVMIGLSDFLITSGT